MTPASSVRVPSRASGGQTWDLLGSDSLGQVSSLALSADRQTLYAATATGVWRIQPGD